MTDPMQRQWLAEHENLVQSLAVAYDRIFELEEKLQELMRTTPHDWLRKEIGELLDEPPDD